MTTRQKRRTTMGRKRPWTQGGGGGKSPSVSDQLLRRRIESSGNNYSSAEELVDHLRSTHPEYSRHNIQSFTKRVSQLLELVNRECHRQRSIMESHGSDELYDDYATPLRKRPKKVDKSEERLQLIEKQHIRKRAGRFTGDILNDGSLASSTTSTASTSTSAESESETDKSSEEDISSDDAVYGEKFEPICDLTKSGLRDNYKEKSNKIGKEGNMKEAVEIEVINNDDKKVNLVNERCKTEYDSESQKKIGYGLTLPSDENYDIRNNKPLFKDLGGMSKIVEDLKMDVLVPFYHPEVPRYLGLRPTTGILLHGPPGCGKTKLVHAIANETGASFYKICATELVSGISGKSEENIKLLFDKAYRTAPSIVFIDEIDAIATKRENQNRVMEQRIVIQLMSCMDEWYQSVQPSDGSGNSVSSYSEPVQPSGGSGNSESSYSEPVRVLVFGATNRPDALDPALRRPGRFDKEIILGVPDEIARVDILSILKRNFRVEGGFDMLKIARSTAGFVGADLAAVTVKAGNLAMKRIIDQRKVEISTEPVDAELLGEWWKHPWSEEEIEKLSITMADFEEAVKMVQPSSRREGFSAIPNVNWEDVGGLELLRREFDFHIVRRLNNPEDYEDIGVDLEAGFLLYGPPGCGKTLIAKAVANEAGANFIHVKGPELLNKYVGESELAVRTIFSRARTCSPCIIFFDEVDALTTNRGQEGGWTVSLLNQLLIELDGADQRRGVFVIGATNRPEVMDRAVLRPGRLGKLLYVPLPSPHERGLILTTLARRRRVDATVDLMAIGRDSACENFSGADLRFLMNEAAVAALQDKQMSENSSSDRAPVTIKEIHLKRAMDKITPSVSDRQIQYYEHFSKSLKRA